MKATIGYIYFDFNVDRLRLGFRIQCGTCGHAAIGFIDDCVSKKILSEKFDYRYCSECGKKYFLYRLNSLPDFLEMDVMSILLREV